MHRFWNQILRPLLDAAIPASVLEIGSGQGDCTKRLIEYCRGHGARLTVVDPEPEWEISGWTFEGGEIAVHLASPSLEALPVLGYHDVAFVDGDHCWYTVIEELRGLAAMAARSGRRFPLTVMHDVGWPYGRRDGYYVRERIPAEFLKPNSQKGVLYGVNGLQDEGLISRMYKAETEGGERNGVLTAVEDFLRETDLDLRWLYIEGIHGIGVLADNRTLADNAELRSLIDALTLSDAARKYVKGLEENRISSMLSSMRFEKWASELHAHAQALQEWGNVLSDRLTAALRDRDFTLGRLHDAQRSYEELYAVVRHMERSKSWRWTAWMRRLQKALRGSRQA